MPAKSSAQYGFMAARMKGLGAPTGPSQVVAKEFVDKTSPDKRSQFAKVLANKRKKKPFGA